MDTCTLEPLFHSFHNHIIDIIFLYGSIIHINLEYIIRYTVIYDNDLFVRDHH